MKNQPRLMIKSLKNGKSERRSTAARHPMRMMRPRRPAMMNSSASRALPEKPLWDGLVTLR